MPGTAQASGSPFPSSSRLDGSYAPAAADLLAPVDRAFLMQLERRAIEYFRDNQMPDGLVLDRQRNHASMRLGGLYSTAATGMGFIAIALASAPPYSVLTRHEAIVRVRAGVRTALERLPEQHGILPHFIDSSSGDSYGVDHLSTIDSSWLVAGALWAATFLKDAELEAAAAKLYERVDWHYWTAPEDGKTPGLVRHGKRRSGRFLPDSWDRINGETIFMYVLGAGADEPRALPPSVWRALKTCHSMVAGLRHNNADLGLFVFQYGLDLVDFGAWKAPGGLDLLGEARIATVANRRACRDAAPAFATYRRYWGLSAGDGPGESIERDTYRCYTPVGPIDGTAHITATLASVAHDPDGVIENLRRAQQDSRWSALGRYGFSSINMDRDWVARDMIGIDAGAAVMAVDNYLMGDRVRKTFDRLPCVRRGLERLGFAPAACPSASPAPRAPSAKAS